jgi:Wzt C-terminal domain
VPQRSPKKRSQNSTQNTNGVGVARRAVILKLEVLDEEGEHCEELPSGGTLTVRVHLRYGEAMEQSSLGISVRSQKEGVEVFWTDTAFEGAPLGRKEEGEQAKIDFTFVVPLGSGIYKVDASLTDSRAEDWDVESTLVVAQKSASLEITEEGALSPARGMVRMPVKVEIQALEGRQQRPT